VSHVLLIGFMGAGKSTVGTALAGLLGRPFVDLDASIVAGQGRSIAEIFASDGEARFRELELAEIERLRDAIPSVVACGGGIVTSETARALLRELGTVVYLRITADEALARIGDRSTRPLLSGSDEEAAGLLASRTGFYSEVADITIDASSGVPSSLAEQIAARVSEGAAVSGLARVQVPVPGARYEVIIGTGALESAGAMVRGVTTARRVVLVTDENTHRLFGSDVESALEAAGFEVLPLSVPAGEGSKSWATAGSLLESVAALGLDRTEAVVALGGGVVGDLAGFVAATYLRGVDLVQIPTTLLAQVDSSVGGKTGVDLRAGKNLAGAFKQPMLVIADTQVLASLPGPEWASGMAEIAKSAAICGEEFFCWVEENADALVSHDSAVLAEAVKRSVEFKSGIVCADEREAGLRACLNYGHTFGHALENVAGYGSYPHGIAVAEGMRFAIRLAVEAGSAGEEFARRQDALLDRLGLSAIPEAFGPRELLAAMHSDKKVKCGTVRFVLADRPGSWACRSVDDEVIEEHLRAWSASKRGNR
jgi:3-dehydroquinate synthase